MLSRSFCLLIAFAFTAWSARAAEIDSVLTHPPVDAMFSCSEHFAGQLPSLGDALGSDCVVQKLVEIDGRLFARSYTADGSRNGDWFGWNQPLLSPCDCEVVKLRENPETNAPGILGNPPASSIVLRRDDGVHFLLAHIQHPAVVVGERVAAGQAIAKIGNNGYGRSPHVHMGAWKGDTPLQIRWDQSKMRLPPEFRQ